MPYFDHSATTPIHPDVQELMIELNSRHFGNPSSIHRYGQKSRALIEKARKQIAALINCRPGEVIFTSGGTEANNAVLWNQLASTRAHIIISAVEHPAILTAAEKLARLGIPTTVINSDSNGLIDPESIDSAVQKYTGLISVMLANNETGTIQPIREIAHIGYKHKIPVHTDAVQAIGKIPVDVDQLNVDFLTISGHKFYGPKGVGALYRRQGSNLRPLLLGGGQEQNQRSGTENVPGIAGMGLAAELASAKLPVNSENLKALENQFRDLLKAQLPDIKYNGHQKLHLPGLISVTIPGVSNDVLVVSLDMAGIAISNGSACSAGTVKPSHVLQAMGLSAADNRQTVRISFGLGNTNNEVEQLAAGLVETVNKIRNR